VDEIDVVAGAEPRGVPHSVGGERRDISDHGQMRAVGGDGGPAGAIDLAAKPARSSPMSRPSAPEKKLSAMGLGRFVIGRRAGILEGHPHPYNAPMSAEKYLKPEVIQSVARLDLRAKFIVEGFLSGLHGSPFQGLSVEFAEHRKYVPGDDVKEIDWKVYARTGKHYLRKYKAETNMTGYLVMDLSKSMGYTYRQSLTKFEYGICLAAALGYLMVHQQDPVGLVTFDEALRTVVPPKSKRSQLGTILSVLSNLQPTGKTEIAESLGQLAGMIRGKCLIMLFSDLLSDPEPILRSIYRLRHAGHEVILFHILDEAEVHFPFTGLVEFEDVESDAKLEVDARGMRADYLESLGEFRERWKTECGQANADYVPMDTSVNFDKALLDYLILRQRRFA
jgi:uncharacterized protein (DUF58 family)